MIPSPATAAMDPDLTRGLVVFGVTFAVLAIVIVGVGLLLLFRMRDGARPTTASGLGSLRRTANIQLVRVDEELAAGDDELGFAIAQFGEAATAEFAVAVARAHTQVGQAFRIKQTIDDAIPEPDQTVRERVLQIIALCESAHATLASHDRSFSDLRGREVNAPAGIAAVRERIASTQARLVAATATVERLRAWYVPALSAEVAARIDEVAPLLADAAAMADAADSRLSPAGVNAVVGDLRAAEEKVHRAAGLIDSVDRRAAELDAAAAALSTLVAATTADLGEARAQRDAAPDPETGAAIVAAVAETGRVLARIAASAGPTNSSQTSAAPTNPITDLDELGAAVAELDTALASARNQKERLEHARTALTGTLVSARSQISTVSAFISAGGRRVGADARTRLTEAERQLMLAETEADPVEALDAARRSVTHARDADALARYAAMSRG